MESEAITLLRALIARVDRLEGKPSTSNDSKPSGDESTKIINNNTNTEQSLSDVSSISSLSDTKKTKISKDRTQHWQLLPNNTKLTIKYKGHKGTFTKIDEQYLSYNIEGKTGEYCVKSGGKVKNVVALNGALMEFLDIIGSERKSMNAWKEFKVNIDGKIMSVGDYAEKLNINSHIIPVEEPVVTQVVEEPVVTQVVEEPVVTQVVEEPVVVPKKVKKIVKKLIRREKQSYTPEEVDKLNDFILCKEFIRLTGCQTLYCTHCKKHTGLDNWITSIRKRCLKPAGLSKDTVTPKTCDRQQAVNSICNPINNRVYPVLRSNETSNEKKERYKYAKKVCFELIGKDTQPHKY
jgi:hypothetical protein